MKITDLFNTASNITEVVEKENRKISDSKNTNFKAQLNKIENENYEERIRNLASRIIEQGEKLTKRVDIRELKIYKKLISEFLGEAVGNSLKFSKQGFLDRRGRHRVFAVVKKINKEIGLLTEEVLSNEKDNIKIMQRLDVIKGLILDLVM